MLTNTWSGSPQELFVQAAKAARVVSEAIGLTVTVEDLAEIITKSQPTTTSQIVEPAKVVKSKKLHPAAPQSKANKADGRRSRYKTQSQKPGDIRIDIVKSHTGKSQSWKHVPIDQLFDGEEHTVFLPTSQIKIGKTFQTNLRHRASKLGFGVKMTKLAVNRYRFQLVELRPVAGRPPNYQGTTSK